MGVGGTIGVRCTVGSVRWAWAVRCAVGVGVGGVRCVVGAGGVRGVRLVWVVREAWMVWMTSMAWMMWIMWMAWADEHSAVSVQVAGLLAGATRLRVQPH